MKYILFLILLIFYFSLNFIFNTELKISIVNNIFHYIILFLIIAYLLIESFFKRVSIFFYITIIFIGLFIIFSLASLSSIEKKYVELSEKTTEELTLKNGSKISLKFLSIEKDKNNKKTYKIEINNKSFELAINKPIIYKDINIYLKSINRYENDSISLNLLITKMKYKTQVFVLSIFAILCLFYNLFRKDYDNN